MHTHHCKPSFSPPCIYTYALIHICVCVSYKVFLILCLAISLHLYIVKGQIAKKVTNSTNSFSRIPFFHISVSQKCLGTICNRYPHILAFAGQVLKLSRVCLTLKFCISWAMWVICTERIFVRIENFKF